MDLEKAKFQVGQSVKITHTWAKDIPPQTIETVVWDENWNCFTYSFPGRGLRIEEHEIKLVEDER